MVDTVQVRIAKIIKYEITCSIKTQNRRRSLSVTSRTILCRTYVNVLCIFIAVFYVFEITKLRVFANGDDRSVLKPQSEKSHKQNF
jgi:hypothetical protein